MIDSCLGVTAIGLGITGVSLLSTIIAAPSVIGMEAVSIVMDYFELYEIEQLKRCHWK